MGECLTECKPGGGGGGGLRYCCCCCCCYFSGYVRIVDLLRLADTASRAVD